MFLLVGSFQVLIIPFRSLYAAINIYWLSPNLPLLHFLGIAAQQQQFPFHKILLGMRRLSTASESPGLFFRRFGGFSKVWKGCSFSLSQWCHVGGVSVRTGNSLWNVWYFCVSQSTARMLLTGSAPWWILGKQAQKLSLYWFLWDLVEREQTQTTWSL